MSYSATVTDLPGDDVVSWLVTRARSQPDATAVVCDGARISYAALDRRASATAARLVALGIGPEDRVALCLDRTADAIVGLFGILYAGAAYLPIDTGLPRRRIGELLELGRVAALVTESAMVELAAGRPVVCVDDPDPAPAPSAPGRISHPATLAYAIFTSGSTGVPKLVGIEHRQLAQFIRSFVQRHQLEPGRYAVVSSLAGDAAHTMIFPAIGLGGELHVLPPAVATDPQALTAYLARERIDYMSTMPVHAMSLLRFAAPGRICPARRLFIGGEILPPELAQTLLTAGSSCTVINSYGPTETTVLAVSHEVASVEPESSVPIGRAFTGPVQVLDARFHPVLAEERGELYIGGGCVGRGYLDQPALTAERFVPDPMSSSGARMYRTGDRVQARTDGVLMFLGRSDEQVKIRGHRVEPGELRGFLRRCAGVADAAVIVQASPHGPRLMAFVVGGDESSLLAACRKHLPDSLVPAAIMVTDALPMTVTGKVDVRGLLGPSPTRSIADPPRGELEVQVAQLWCEILGVDAVDRNDDFFALGGYSLLAGQLVARVRNVLRVQLSVLDIFNGRTLATIARAIAVAPPAADEIVRADRSQRLPLSFSQERIWFMEQLAGGSLSHVCAFGLRLRGSLDVDALEAALGDLVARHEALRTTFHDDAGVPYQRIHPPFAVTLTRIDLGDLPEKVRDEELERAIHARFTQPMATDDLPLFRYILFRLADDEHALLVLEHHHIHDGWSIRVQLADLQVLYASRLAGSAPSLPALAVQYADYAVWQRRTLGAERLAALTAWWRDYLANAPAHIDLRTDRPRPPVSRFHGQELVIAVPEALIARLRGLARREGATLFAAALAGFAVMLRRHATDDDMVIGTTVAARDRSELEGIVGMMVNSVPLRIMLAGNPSFRSLLGRVAASTAQAFAHQDLPFDHLVRAINPPRDPARPPVFQVDFSFHDASIDAPRLGDAHGSVFYPPHDYAKFDLSVTLMPGARPTLMWEYNQDIFDRSTIDRMVAQYLEMLEVFCSDPDRPILGSRQPHVAPTSVPDRDEPEGLAFWIEAQVDRTPDAIAVEAAGDRASYRELDTRANQLARALRARGLGPEQPVALQVGRSLELAVGMLGVLKAGATLVPIDPREPPVRRDRLLADSGAQLVVTDRATRPLLGELGVAELCVDSTEVNAQVGERLAPLAVGANAACILYTSGSSGQPKGVTLTHAGLANHHRWQATRFALQPGERVLQFHTIGFDAAFEEMLPSWIGGATVVMRPDELFGSAHELVSWCRRAGITMLNLPAAYWIQLVGELADDPVPLPETLRLLTVGGERTPGDVLRTWLACGGRALAWHNTYGPTEASVVATEYEIAAGGEPTVGFPPIGRAISGVTVHVVDDELRTVTDGVVGELVIGGAGLARGYVGRPGSTADKFIPDPSSPRPGARLYRTGDLGFINCNGDVEYVGRADDQLKIRGVRIEPAEVEAAVRSHPAVRHVAVTAAGQPGAQQLVAYVVATDIEVDAAALRSYVAASMPGPMVPSRWVVVDALPLSPNGKLDRRALPPLDDAPAAPSPASYASPLERELASIWEDVLGVTRVARDANFFDLGGHSMLAMRLVARIRQRLGIELRLRAVMEGSTLAQLAAAIATARTGAAPHALSQHAT